MATFGVYLKLPQGLSVTLTVKGEEMVVGAPATQITREGMVRLVVRNSTAGGLVVVHGLNVSANDADAMTTIALSIAAQACAGAPKNK